MLKLFHLFFFCVLFSKYFFNSISFYNFHLLKENTAETEYSALCKILPLTSIGLILKSVLPALFLLNSNHKKASTIVVLPVALSPKMLTDKLSNSKGFIFYSFKIFLFLIL